MTQRVWAGDTLYKLRVLGSAPESHRDFITLHLPSLAAIDNAELPVNYNNHNKRTQNVCSLYQED